MVHINDLRTHRVVMAMLCGLGLVLAVWTFPAMGQTQGNNSCQGNGACEGNTGSIGSNSCNGNDASRLSRELVGPIANSAVGCAP